MMSAQLLWLIRHLGIDKRVAKPIKFNDRLKIQKAVFLLNHLNVEPFNNYDFSLYLRGPYSSQLATEYYNLPISETIAPRIRDEQIRVLDWFMKHNQKWLEIASSIILVSKKYRDMQPKEMLALLKMSKPWIVNEKFYSILSELREKGLVHSPI